MDSRDIFRQIGKGARQAQDVSALTFVALAQTDQFDDVTITEHAELFAPWDALWTGKRGTILLDDGSLYRALHDVLTPAQNRKPSDDTGMQLWQRIGNPGDEWPEWVRWYGVGDAYTIGAQVSHNGKRWVCVLGNADGVNTWEPGVYGWDEVGAA